jgi:hypothetical protein
MKNMKCSVCGVTEAEVLDDCFSFYCYECNQRYLEMQKTTGTVVQISAHLVGVSQRG